MFIYIFYSCCFVYIAFHLTSYSYVVSINFYLFHFIYKKYLYKTENIIRAMSSSSDSDINELLSSIVTYAYQYFGIFLYIIGNFGNLLTLWIFSKKSWRRKVCVFYFFLCLISNTIFINSVFIGAILIHGFNINILIYNPFLCKIYFYVAYVLSICYPMILILATIDRLLISSQNVDTRLYSSKRLAYFSSCICMFLWLIFSIHILIKVNIHEIYPTYFICYYDLYDIQYQLFNLYTLLIITVVVFFSMIILSILSFKNVRLIKPISRQQRHRTRSMSRKDFQLLRSLYVHNIAYNVWTALTVGGLCFDTVLAHKIPTDFERILQLFLGNMGGLLHYVPFCTSFFIFISISRSFRQELKCIIYQIIRKDVRMIRDEDMPEHELPATTNN